MDTAHVSLCTMHLLASGFARYQCQKDLAIGLSLSNLAKILKCASNDDSITLQCSESGPDTCAFTFESNKSGKVSEFEFKLMDIDSENLNIPDLAYDANLHLNSKQFRTIISDLAQLGDTCTISVTEKTVSFAVEGNLGSAQVTLKKNLDDKKDPDHVLIEMTKPVSISFAMHTLQHFTKATQLSDVVHICLSSDQPLMVEYTIPNIGFIKYYLAPKLDEV